MEFNTELFDTLGHYETYTNDIIVNGTNIGRADVIVDTQDDTMNYIEWPGINEEFRNLGYGTMALNLLAIKYGRIFFAPADENSKRLYDRIANEITVDLPPVDQGYGVYYIQK